MTFTKLSKTVVTNSRPQKKNMQRTGCESLSERTPGHSINSPMAITGYVNGTESRGTMKKSIEKDPQNGRLSKRRTIRVKFILSHLPLALERRLLLNSLRI